MEIEYFAILFCLSLIVPISYIKIVSGFTASITQKLTSANFEWNLNKIRRLTIGYGGGSLLFSYIFHQFFKYNLINQNFFDANLIMPIIALSFCYLARVITRRNGHISGKIYLNSITAIASFIFLINTFGALTNSGIEYQFDTFIIEFQNNLLFRISATLLFIKEWIVPLVTGSFLMAFIGEIVVFYLINPSVRSVPSVLEKFPSDFSVITGNNNIENKMKKMTSRKCVHSIKCITNTYKVFDVIHSNLEDQWRKLPDEKNSDYRIIGSSTKEINKYINDTNFRNFGKIIGPIYKTILKNKCNISTREKEISNRISKLKRMQDEGRIKHVEASFGKFRMLIVNDNEVMFTVFSGTDEKIGLYTEEKYVIQLCINLFEDSWERLNT